MADPFTLLLSAIGGGAVIGPAVAFFLKAQGKKAIDHGKAELTIAESDAALQAVLIEQLKNAEERAKVARAEAAEMDKALGTAREETGQHRAQLDQVKRTYDERLRTVERLTSLQMREIEQCTADREKCAEDLKAVEKRLSERMRSMSPPAFPAVKPPDSR